MANDLLLSKLAFECIKDSITLPNGDFQYSAFTRGEYDNNDDYILQEKRFWAVVNTAITKLVENNKLPTNLEQVEVLRDENNRPYFIKPDNVEQILNVIDFYNEGHHNFTFREVFENGQRVVKLNSNALVGDVVYIEYKQQIPRFKKEDIIAITEEVGLIIDNNVDLSSYGINRSMFDFLCEYCKGEIMFLIDPAIGTAIKNNAEYLLQTLKTYSEQYAQDNIYSDGLGIF